MVTSQITIPSPRTWSPRDLVTVPRLRADVADTVALLLQRPLFSGQRTLGDNWPTGTTLSLAMDVELTDTWNGHLGPPGTGTANYWCQLPGWYLCDMRVPFAYSSTTPAPFMCGFQGITGGAAFGPVFGALQVNGSGQATVARSVDLIEQVVTGPPNGAGDLILPVTRQDSGGTVSLGSSAGNLPTVAIRWVRTASGGPVLPVPPLTACPTPITSAWLNANVRDAANFLICPPALRAHYTAGSSVLANSGLASPAVVPLTTVDVDNYSGFTTGASAHYTAPVSGRYFFAGQINLAASSTTTLYACGLRVNGATVYWGGIVRFAGTSLAGGAAVVKRLRLNAGDQVQLIAAQESGSSIAYNTTASNQTRMLAVWEGI